MNIGGFQKLTLLDYPGETACIVFTAGCNFRCPFCHNSGLVTGDFPVMPQAEVFEYLNKRRGILDGVVISGGEPLMQPGILEFAEKVKSMGYLLKIDTNGSFPDRLSEIIKFSDYAALDIKHDRENYGLAVGRNDVDIENIERSIDILKRGEIKFEFRTTVVKGIHNIESIENIARWISGEQPYYLQPYIDSGNVLLPGGISDFSKAEMEEMLEKAQKYCPSAEIRGKAL